MRAFRASCAILGILVALPAAAQVTDGPAGCAGIPIAHCGIAAAAASFSPVSGAFAFQPMAGVSVDAHFRLWAPGLAIMGGGYVDTQGHSGTRYSLAPFASLGDWAGIARGLFLAAAFGLPPNLSQGFRGWTWAGNFQILVGGSPDLVGLLQKGPAL